MKNYVEVLKDTLQGVTTEDLFVPFNESEVHNLDLILLRASLESYFGMEIPDNDWDRLNTLYDTLEYCRKRMHTVASRYNANARISTERSHEITMPKMANRALSENWLLKELGDMHWELLSKGLEQKSSEFTDCQGNRLYAAFVRVRYAVSRLNKFTEGDQLHLDSQISRYGSYTYYTKVKGTADGKTIHADLMTSFSARKQNDNAQIAKSNLEEKINHVPILSATPDFYNEHRLLKKGLVSEITSGGYNFTISGEELETVVHTLNPHYEINGVGLVYFAVYPIIADRCATEFFTNTMEMADYDSRYHTIYRDIFYYANCNADDKIVVKLNNVKLVGDDKIQLCTSLYRQSDNALMARVFTVKEKS